MWSQNENHHAHVLVAAIALLVTTSGLLAQGKDPVVGTWVLNLAKSSYSPGPAPKSETRTYVTAGSDMKLTLEGIDGAGKPISIQASYSLDGREHPIVGSPDADSQVITRIDAFRTSGTLKKAGKARPDRRVGRLRKTARC